VISRQRLLFDWDIFAPAVKESFAKLDPRWQVRNPVMFIVEVGALVSALFAVRDYTVNSGLGGKPATAIAIFQLPGSNALATSDAVRMSYWNSDGSHGALCGNAALCGGRLAVHLELVPAGEFCLLTDAGAVRVSSPATGEEAEINLPDFDLSGEFRGAALKRGERWMTLLQVGVPHLVIRVDDIEAVDVAGRGRSLRSVSKGSSARMVPTPTINASAA